MLDGECGGGEELIKEQLGYRYCWEGGSVIDSDCDSNSYPFSPVEIIKCAVSLKSGILATLTPDCDSNFDPFSPVEIKWAVSLTVLIFATPTPDSDSNFVPFSPVEKKKCAVSLNSLIFTTPTPASDSNSYPFSPVELQCAVSLKSGIFATPTPAAPDSFRLRLQGTVRRWLSAAKAKTSLHQTITLKEIMWRASGGEVLYSQKRPKLLIYSHQMATKIIISNLAH